MCGVTLPDLRQHIQAFVKTIPLTRYSLLICREWGDKRKPRHGAQANDLMLPSN